MQHPAVDLDRHVPVRLRRQPHDLELLGAVPVGRLRSLRVVGKPGVGHRGPQHVLECAHLIGDDREAREHDHPVLPGELAEPEGIVRPTDGPVVVEVEPGLDARVRRGDEEVGVVDRVGALL
jgi:hypothetical protein